MTSSAAPPSSARVAEVGVTMLRLGCTSFGGPIAHLGYLRAEIVERRKWLDDAAYADIVALCQFLPGPSSSQVVFALGMHRARLAGALIASACFTLPSALLMLAFAYGAARAGSLQGAGWLHGLSLAAVAVVAQAVWSMGRALCTDRTRILLALLGAAILTALPGAVTQLAVLFLGGFTGYVVYRRSREEPRVRPTSSRRSARWAAAFALAFFALLLVLLPLLASASGSRALALFDAFYRSGSLVFGGGHVVLPLLRAETVPRGWLSDEQFLAGYAAAQALPGPLFTFAAYLGASMTPAAPSWQAGLIGLLAIFLPSWLLVGGTFPFWPQLRAQRWARAALMGTNASVVGVLLAALYSPVCTESVHGPRDAVAAVVGFVLLQRWKVPPWGVVLGLAAAGQWCLGP